jgi:hypothetical protein
MFYKNFARITEQPRMPFYLVKLFIAELTIATQICTLLNFLTTQGLHHS